MANLKGKAALVTGAAAGLGFAIAKNLSLEGAIVFINDVNSDKLKEARNMLLNNSDSIYAYPCDITDKSAVSSMFEFIYSKAGKLDILVNNAGIILDSFFHKMSDEAFDKVIKVNLYGAYNCTRLAIESMRQNNYGRIINISSVVGISGNMGQVNYSASKAALIGFTKSLALENALKGVTVNAVAPGFIKSDMTAKIPPEAIEKILIKIPMGKFGEPEDISSLVSFLAGEQAGYITGQVISVNGGFLT